MPLVRMRRGHQKDEQLVVGHTAFQTQAQAQREDFAFSAFPATCLFLHTCTSRFLSRFKGEAGLLCLSWLAGDTTNRLGPGVRRMTVMWERQPPPPHHDLP